MHLGLIEGTFVPHDLISTQDSPVHLLEFQTKNLSVLWVQERNPNMLYLFSQKVPANEPPPGPQRGPCGERYPFIGHYLHISRKFHKNSSK